MTKRGCPKCGAECSNENCRICAGLLECGRCSNGPLKYKRLPSKGEQDFEGEQRWKDYVEQQKGDKNA